MVDAAQRSKRSDALDASATHKPAGSVFIVSGIRLMQDGLSHAIAAQDQFEVRGVAGDGPEVLEQIQRLRPDVVLVHIPEPTALARVGRIRAAAPGARVVAIAVPEVEETIVACVEAGVAGYVTLDGSLDDLVATLESVMRDESLCSPRIAATLMRRLAVLAARRNPAPELPRLTTRELEVIDLIDQGLSNKQIAVSLCIGLSTVKNHVHNVLEKLQVERRSEAAAVVNGRSQSPKI